MHEIHTSQAWINTQLAETVSEKQPQQERVGTAAAAAAAWGFMVDDCKRCKSIISITGITAIQDDNLAVGSVTNHPLWRT
jgi:hypothetical protein